MVSTTADLTPARRDESGRGSRLRIAAGGRAAPPVRGGGDGSARVPLAAGPGRNLRALDGELAAPDELDVITAEQHLVSLALQLQAAQAAIAAELSDLRAGLGRVAACPVAAIRRAQAAGDWELATRLLSDHFPGLVLDRQGAPLPEPLTDSEMRVLRYLATTHLAGPEIAGELFISVNTVRTHMRHIYEKLGVHRRSEAVERAYLLGLLAPTPPRPAWSPGQNAEGAG